MALIQEVRQQWNTLINSGNIRRVVIPAGAPVAVVSDNAAAANAYPAANLHIQIVAAAVITDPSWFAGVTILFNNLEAACFADLAIGFGVDAAGIDRAEFAYYNEIAAGAGITHTMPTYELAFPIRIAGAPRVAGRIRKSSVASAVGITPKVNFYTAVGT